MHDKYEKPNEDCCLYELVRHLHAAIALVMAMIRKKHGSNEKPNGDYCLNVLARHLHMTLHASKLSNPRSPGRGLGCELLSVTERKHDTCHEFSITIMMSVTITITIIITLIVTIITTITLSIFIIIAILITTDFL